MKVKITRQRIIVLVSSIVIILLAAAIYPHIPLPIYSVDYYGTTVKFRIDLRDVKEVPVYPSEEAVYNEVMNQPIQNITLAYKVASEEENGLYAIETYEIVNKLATAFIRRFGYTPNFTAVNVTSYEGLTGTTENLVIVLVHPTYSNETSVRLENHLIFISGKNSTTLTGQLRNFDLATVKFLMTVLEIKI